jgi:hypothetical protein
MAHLLEADDLDENDIGELFDYLRGRSSLPDKRSERCVECRGYVVLNPEAGDYVCVECGLCQPGRAYYVECWDDQERITVGPREGYKPIHHWHERLSQYHLQESAINPEHWATILDQLLTARPKALCKETIRKILRTAKLQRYNENWLQIINRVTGYVPPRIEQNEVLLLDRIFEGVCVPFSLFKPAARKNLLNYNFVLYRLFELIGRGDCLCHFPQLKTHAKWLELDRVWGQICEYNDWQHPPYEAQTWLAVPMTEAAWLRVDRLTFDAAWDVGLERVYGKAPRLRKPTHSYASRRILSAYARESALQQSITATAPLPRGRHSAMTQRSAKRRLRDENSGAACARSAKAARP